MRKTETTDVRRAAESRVHMPLDEYFRAVASRQRKGENVTQRTMAAELGTTAATVNKWLQSLGFESCTVLVER